MIVSQDPNETATDPSAERNRGGIEDFFFEWTNHEFLPLPRIPHRFPPSPLFFSELFLLTRRQGNILPILLFFFFSLFAYKWPGILIYMVEIMVVKICIRPPSFIHFLPPPPSLGARNLTTRIIFKYCNPLQGNIERRFRAAFFQDFA